VLAHLTGIDQQKVLDAMLAAGGDRPRDFTDNVQLLQTIRKAL
jgi:putative intracellular protease/amidase